MTERTTTLAEIAASESTTTDEAWTALRHLDNPAWHCPSDDVPLLPELSDRLVKVIRARAAARALGVHVED